MLYFVERNSDCVGCGACLAVCPTHCIEMKKDKEGFWYPSVNENCIKCGKCERVCPICKTSVIQNLKDKKVYAGVSKNSKIWRRSSSGGAFSEICKIWDSGNTLFCGAAWNGLSVKQTCVIGYKNITALCKSKYITSNPNNCFIQICKHLEDGGSALFCGTPCQVDGLRKYLGKEYDKLLLIDFICHGVGSEDVFHTCTDILGEQLGFKIKEYSFRAKRKAYEIDHMQHVKSYENRSCYVVNDRFMQLFLSQKCLRPSCGENCKYRNEIRQGDITIADFKGLTTVFPKLLGTKRNYSAIIFNTQKSLSLLPELKKNMHTLCSSIEEIKKYNPLYYRQTYFCKERDQFFNEYVQSKRATVLKYTVKATVSKLNFKKWIVENLPEKFRKLMYKVKGSKDINEKNS